MLFLFLAIAIGTFGSLLAADYGASGKSGTAHFLFKAATRAGTIAIVVAAAGSLYLAVSLLLWLIGILV